MADCYLISSPISIFSIVAPLIVVVFDSPARDAILPFTRFTVTTSPSAKLLTVAGEPSYVTDIFDAHS